MTPTDRNITVNVAYIIAIVIVLYSMATIIARWFGV